MIFNESLQDVPLLDDEIAIIGMAGRFPGANDVASFWSSVVQGKSSITRWDQDPNDGPDIVPAGGLLADIDLFDASAFGLTPSEADMLDPQHRIFAESCWNALEHAAIVPNDQCLVSVYASSSPSNYQPWAPGDVNGQYQRMIANAPDFLATRIAHLLDLRGEAINVQTACSSSLVAVHLACQSLQAGRSDVALAGGVTIDPDQHMGYRYQEGMVSSPSGFSYPFDSRAQGAVPGNGSAVVALQRLGDARSQGRKIHAVIRASAVNQDGRAKASFMAPSIEGQSDLITSVLALADVPADTITYLEAHGTGTRIGDPIEVEAATQAFRSFTNRTGFCSLGSLKAAFGHLDRAAGVTGLIKAVHVVRDGVIPPLVGFDTANPDLELETSPFRVDSEARTADIVGPRRAGVSAFGVGGTNAHMIVESAVALPTLKSDSELPVVLAVSAHSKEVLSQLTARISEHLRNAEDGGSLSSVAKTLGSGREARSVRAAVVAADRETAATLLEKAQRQASKPENKVALLFAGQGAEIAFRPEALMKRYSVFREEIEHFAEALGCSVTSLLEGVSGTSSRVRAFAYQPSLGAMQVALARLVQDFGVQVDACCGSSIGEYASAHLAGVLDHEELMGGLAVRAEVMERTPAGRMLSLSCSATRAEEVLVEGMEFAGDNASDRVLVSGPINAVDSQLEALRRAGIRGTVLPGIIAPHSALMNDAAGQIAASVSGNVPDDPQVPVVSTVTGEWIQAVDLADSSHWARHMRRPIQFRQALSTLLDAGINRFIEASPGNALTSLVARTDASECHAVSLGGPADSKPEESLLASCAELWTAGVEISWDAVNTVRDQRYAELPDYPFRRRRHWSHDPVRGGSEHKLSASTGGLLGRPVWRPSGASSSSRSDALPKEVTIRGTCSLAGRLSERLSKTDVVVRQLRSEPSAEELSSALYRDDHCLIDLSVADVPKCDVTFEDLNDVDNWLRRRMIDPAADSVRTGADRVLFVSRGARAVLRGENSRIEEAGAVGLLRCLPHERPGTSTSWLDLERSESSLERDVDVILDELRRPADRDAAFRNGTRYECRYEPLQPSEQTILRPHGAYLALGGNGNLGAVVVDAVSREVQTTIVLAGRKIVRKRSPEQLQLIEQARQRGCAVIEIELDVTDSDKLRATLDGLEEKYGRVNGIFHLAAVTDVDEFPLLEEKNGSHSQVAEAKVLGAGNLLRELDGRRIDVVCLFSSLSTVIGALQFGPYVSANASLDALAESSGLAGRDDSPTHWMSLIWDGWSSDGLSGQDALGHADGSHLLRQALRTRLPVVTATTRDVEYRRDSVARDLLAVAASKTPHGELMDDTMSNVTRTVVEVTGYTSIAADEQLSSLGVDSLKMMQIATRLRYGASQNNVPLGKLLRANSIKEMSLALESQGSGAGLISQSTELLAQKQGLRAGTLSSVQERLWFLDQLDPESAEYNVPFGWRLPLSTTIQTAKSALLVLLERHPILRSAYRGHDDGSVYSTELESDYVEIIELGVGATDDEVRRHIERPIELVHGSTRVMIRSSASVELIFVCHHISVDAWSVRLLHEDLAQILRGEPLPPMAGSYHDFVSWEHERRTESGYTDDLNFWRDALNDVASEPPPADGGRQLTEFLGESETATLLVPATVVSRLSNRLSIEGATMFAAALTGLSVALAAWSRRSQIGLGTNLANRHTPDLERVVGMFVDPVVLSLQPTEHNLYNTEPTVGSALAHVRGVLMEALAHADVPYADVVETVTRSRSSSAPLINVIATMFDTEQGVSHDLVQLDLPQPGAAKFPLAVEFLPKEDGLLLHAIYSSDLYRRDTIDRVLTRTARYLQLLAEFGPEVPLQELTGPLREPRQRFEGLLHRGSRHALDPKGKDAI